jgi:polyferredoxin
LNEDPTTPSHQSTISALRVIEVALRKTRALAIRPRVMAVLIWSACAAASVLLTALMLAALIPSYADILTPSVLGVGLGSVLVGMSLARARRA